MISPKGHTKESRKEGGFEGLEDCFIQRVSGRSSYWPAVCAERRRAGVRLERKKVHYGRGGGGRGGITKLEDSGGFSSWGRNRRSRCSLIQQEKSNQNSSIALF